MDEDSKKGTPTRIEILIENYRESREEGIKLAHSFFTDIAITVTLLGAILTGGSIADEPRLILTIPFLLGGIAIYSIQKLRVNNLITCWKNTSNLSA